MIADHAPKQLEDLKTKVQEDPQTPRRVIREKTEFWCILNANETKNQEKNQKAPRRGGKTG